MEYARARSFTAVLLAVVSVMVATSAFLGCEVDEPKNAKESVLRQDLFAMRSVLDQYDMDKQKLPQSLNDLVTAGYLKELPEDPITGRSDTWVVDWSKDPKMPGIENIHSGSHSMSSDGTAYSTW